MAGLGFPDYSTGVELGFFVFYLIPVTAAAWFSGRWTRRAFGFLSALTWLAAEVRAGRSFASTFVSYWNMAIRLSVFCGASILVHRLREALHREKIVFRTDILTGLYTPEERVQRISLVQRTLLTAQYLLGRD